MFRLKLLALPITFTLFLSLPLSTHAQTNDPHLSKQDYLETIEVFEAWNGQPEAVSPPATAIIGTGTALPTHEDLRVTIPQGTKDTPYDVQPSTSTFAGGIVHALTNNSTGIAGINSSPNFNVHGDKFYSYEAGTQKNLENSPDSVYAFDISAAASHTRDALDKGADLLLTPISVFEDEPQFSVSTNALANPVISIPGTDLEIPRLLADILNALGGWLYQNAQRNERMREFQTAHILAAKGGHFSVAPIGDFGKTHPVYPAYLSSSDIVFSVGGTTKEGTSRWGNSAKSQSGDPDTGTLDVVAPAESVFSTLNSEQPGVPKYGRRSTTVASAAMATGVASRLKGLNSSLAGDDLRQILRRTADDIPPAGYDTETGYGRLNADAAVNYLQERTITHGTATNGNVTILGEDLSFMMTSGAWAELASGQYNVDERYKVKWTIDLPKGSDHDIWVRRPGTKGWTPAHPETGLPGAKIEIRSWEREATITTYGYQGETTDVLGRTISTYGYPTEAQDAKVAYTIATKPGTPPAPPLSVSISGPSSREHGQQGTWTAGYTGGSGSVSYAWEVRTPGSSIWTSTSGTSQSYSDSFQHSKDQWLGAGVRVTVTRGSETATTEQTVAVGPSSCGDPLPCISSNAAGPKSVLFLRELRARGQGAEAAVLRWQAVGAGSSSSFVVQHRTDSTEAWSRLGTVAASDSVAIDTSRGANYRFRAENLSVGTHQFRLRVQRKGAKNNFASRSVTAEIRLKEAYDVTTYPNPVQRQATIELAVRERQNVTVAVYDVLGRQVTTLHDGPLPAQETTRLSLNASQAGLSSGTYFVRVRGESFAGTRRLTVVR